MINEKRILKNYLLWFLCFVLTMFIGIIKTYAITFTDFTDVHSNTQVLVEYRTGSNPIDWPYNNSSLYQNDVIAVNFIISNYSFTANTHYEFESHMLGEYFKNSTSYEVIGANSERCLTDSYYLNFISGSYPRWDFQCSSATNTVSIRIFNSNNSVIMNSGYFGWGSAIISKTTEPISSTGNDTEEIINNANANANAIIDSLDKGFNSCGNLDLPSIEQGSLLGLTGLPQASDGRTRTSSYINVSSSTSYTLSMPDTLQAFVFYYTSSNTFVERVPANWVNNYTFTPYSNVSKIKIVFSKTNNSSITPSETTGISLKYCYNRLDKQTDAIDDLNDTLTDDNTDGAVSDASDFFSDFTTDTFGLTSIITAPLNLIQSLSSSTCSQLELPLPYLDNKKLILPCMTTIYSQYFGSFFTMYQTITYGIIAYWVIVRIFNLVKDFKNPEHDEIEVVDL